VPALAAQFEASLGVGAAPCVALLDMLAAAAGALDGASAAVLAEPVVRVCLRALDVSGAPPPALAAGDAAAGPGQVEAAGVRALVALTLKLPERAFRPQFLRLVEWASAAHVDGADGLSAARLSSLFGATGALAARLRSVFVPYFAYVWDLAAVALGCAAAARADEKSEKRRAKKKARAALELSGSEEAVAKLRFRVLRALRGCFVADTVGFLTDERVAAVMDGVAGAVALPAAPPAAVLDQLTDEDLPPAGPGPAVPDGAAAAAVEAVVALAGALPDDARRKPLHHKVLMATRSASRRPRLLGLECVSRLADRLRDEYLVFVPESVPFLSELLEDPEFEVERRAQELVRQLEGLTGESLEPYMKT